MLKNADLNAMLPSQLLWRGMRDLHKHERAWRHEVCMDLWLTSDPITDGGPCRISRAGFAGSVMRWSCGWWWFAAYTHEPPKWAVVLDRMGRGLVDSIGIAREVPRYHDDRRKWWLAMGRLYADLRRAGL